MWNFEKRSEENQNPAEIVATWKKSPEGRFVNFISRL